MSKPVEPARETWVCYGDDGSPQGCADNMPDACADAGAFKNGFSWADKVMSGYECVRMAPAAQRKVKRAKSK